jgi:hypothetical protein
VTVYYMITTGLLPIALIAVSSSRTVSVPRERIAQPELASSASTASLVG